MRLENCQKAKCRLPVAIPVLISLVLFCGCGEPYQIAKVSGQITKQGKPLPGVFVSFQPVGGTLDDPPGPGSYGRTDEQGNFELKLVTNNQPGAVVGPQRVVLKHSDDSGKAPAEDLQARLEDPNAPPIDDRERFATAVRRAHKARMIPRHLRDGSTRFEVPPEGTDQANFEVTKR